MCKLRLILLILLSFVLAGSAYEVRIWEDVDGNQVEGRFLREMFGKLTIEAEDGGTRGFNLEELSEVDQKYLRVVVPPKIEVEVRSKTESIPDRPQYLKRDEDTFEHQVTVVVTKKSQRPFTSRLKADIFLIAEEVEGSNHILLNRTENEFLLPTVTKGVEIEFKSSLVRTTVFRDIISQVMKGEDFQGYLVVISTLQDEIVLMDSNLPSWFEDPEIIENLRELSIRGAPSVRSRHFDKTGKKVPPPRPEYRPATAD